MYRAHMERIAESMTAEPRDLSREAIDAGFVHTPDDIVRCIAYCTVRGYEYSEDGEGVIMITGKAA